MRISTTLSDKFRLVMSPHTAGSPLWPVSPGHARQVGYALHALPDDSDVPWHRVINAKGEISIRSEPLFAHIQRQLLEAEGIRFNENGKIPLSKYRWIPDLN